MEQAILILLAVYVSVSVVQMVLTAITVCSNIKATSLLKCSTDINREHLRYTKQRDVQLDKTMSDTYAPKALVTLSFKTLMSKHERNEEYIKLIMKILKGAGDGSIQPEQIVQMIKDTGLVPEEVNDTPDVDDEVL